MTPDDIAGQDGQGTGDAGITPVPAPRRDLRSVLLIIVAVILMGWALRAMAVVLVPLVSAILIALAVMPIRDGIRRRVPGWLAWLGHLVAMLVIVLVLALFFGGIFVAARQIVGQFPDPGGQITQMLEEGSDGEGGSEPGDGSTDLVEGAAEGAEAAAEEDRPPGEGGAGEGNAGGGESGGGEPGGSESDGGEPGGALGRLLPDGSAGDLLRSLGERAAGAASGVATAILNSVLALVAGLVLIFFLTLLILIESDVWRRKLREIARPQTRWRLLESADVIADKVRRYLLIQGALGVVTAVLYAIWLWFWGVELVLVWSLLTLLLVFIPTVGSLVAGVLPVAYSLLTQDATTAIGVGVGLLAIEQVMGNFAEPRFQGRNIALSPLVILVSLTFWAWVWGLAGALLAVPVTVALVVLGSHMEMTRAWSLLLSDQTDLDGLDEVTRPE